MERPLQMFMRARLFGPSPPLFSSGWELHVCHSKGFQDDGPQIDRDVWFTLNCFSIVFMLRQLRNHLEKIKSVLYLAVSETIPKFQMD